MNTCVLILRSLSIGALLFGPTQLFAQTDASQSTYIKARENSNLCFHKKHNGWANGNPVQLWACNAGQVSWKTWVYDKRTGYIRSAGNRSKCIHKQQDNWNNGNLLHLWDCDSGRPEFKSWDYEQSSGLIRARHNDKKCIHKKLNNWANGNPLHIWSCDQGVAGAKAWKLQAATTPPPSNDQATNQQYRVVNYQPTRIPADLESWLNSRMKGHSLIGISRSESGKYTGVFRRLSSNSQSYRYKATVVSEDSLEAALSSASEDGWSLVAMTSFEAGPRGVQLVLFFRHRTTQAH